VGNSGKDMDNVLSITAEPKVLYTITDGVDKKDLMCRDHLVPVRVENVFLHENKLNLVLCTMQDRKTYDLILASYSLSGVKLKETPLANNRNLHETCAMPEKREMCYSWCIAHLMNEKNNQTLP